MDTAADDPCLIGFTSGTTGKPKGAVHFHRDVLAICDTFVAEVLKPSPDDVFAGSPPLAFTYGLGGLLIFPFWVGASTALVEKVSPQALLQTVQDARVTTLFTSPTMFRALLDLVPEFDLSTLKDCVSAGEPLPLPTYQAWERATGSEDHRRTGLDGVAAHLHHRRSRRDRTRRDRQGGYRAIEARVVDDAGEPLPRGEVGLLAVRGPTGCRYLDDAERQHGYVRGAGTSPATRTSRTSRLLLVPGARRRHDHLRRLQHRGHRDRKRVAGPPARSRSVASSARPTRSAATSSRRSSCCATADAGERGWSRELQDFVKQEIAPYKYPRAIEFVTELPRTETGKLQRYKLRSGPV